jgi:UDP:flavonoid glycosyltransferase YjiC (YdhE family)
MAASMSQSAGSAPRPILLAAFGDPGHAFPMIALGRALVARGHDVWLQTWQRWQTHVEAEGMNFAAAPEYDSPPVGPAQLGFYAAAQQAAVDTLPLVEQLLPSVVVADILTLAPALAAEVHGVPFATLIPHVYPPDAPGLPIYSLGAQLPRTPVGRAFWELAKAPMRAGVELGRRDLNAVRAHLGLAPVAQGHGGISEQLAIVATFPQLEYPRPWPAHVHVVGPLMWEPPAADVPIPSGTEPLVLVAPSTSQDPKQRLLRAGLEGLAGEPVRVLATVNRRSSVTQTSPGDRGPDSAADHTDSAAAHPHQLTHHDWPANITLVDWVSYARTMPACDVVVCHAGHGTLVRALSCGVPVVACPAVGDMNENAARLGWSGAGVRVPGRFTTARAVRLAVERVLEDAAMTQRARALARWASEHDAPNTAASLVEGLIGAHVAA